MQRKPSAKTTKFIPTVQPSSFAPKNSIIGRILYIIWLLFKWAFVFSSETCINPMTWAIAMVLRGLIFYFILFPYEDAILKYFTLPDGHTSIYFLPVGMFLIWYIVTSTLMFLGVIYGQFGQRNVVVEEGEFSEFEKLADYANNKMRFQSYRENMEFLRGKDK